MAMDMARLDDHLDTIVAQQDEHQHGQGEFSQHCDVAFLDSRGEVQDESGGNGAGEFSECLDFVTEGDVLDFDAAVGECGESGISGEGAGREEDEGRDLENLELEEFGELLEEGGGGGEREGGSGGCGVSEVNSVLVNEVGEEEALLLAEAAKGGDGVSVSDSGECSSGERKESSQGKGGGKAGGAATGVKKKAKVDWTPELHRRFVHAVEQLGVEKAFPSRILELMGVQCLTRHNIASHLQKYRSHRRHLAAREAEAASWTHRRTFTHAPWARTSRRDGLPYLVPLHSAHTPHIQPRPSMMPTLQPQPLHPQPLTTPLKVWGYPTVDHSNVHMWQQPQVAPPSFWQAPDGSYWQHPAASYGAPYPHPMRVPTIAPSPMVAPGFPDDSMSYYSDFDAMYLCNQTYDSDIGRAAGVAACSKPPETHLSKEVLDAAIGEALANPWTPPPLGLKPPSMEGVIAELQRQGINTVPPSTC
ncbi:hypothetical protein M758_3G167200 [Ceratodon purpureus]|uniref:HTH myb-type domain-containing protein n=1 Tax=Ceratodon purpureus TaxID=3225 RepID=A0A8T0IM26_CERPU|nr:hypothetical protein KC19_3G167400 [Ceratodon purpureus]KAG0623348.1 hypothetical protein M758_3G167200 [Ceratodon purpureus]